MEQENTVCIFRESDLIIILYVDEIMALGKTDEMIDELIHARSEFLKIKDDGILTKFRGIKMISLGNVQVSMSRAPLGAKFFQLTAMENVTAVGTPVITSIDYRDRLQIRKPSPEDRHKYKSIAGTLMYLASNTRPDFCVTTRILCS